MGKDVLIEADVAVIGAGPAGATAARLLAQSGVRVLLVERAAEPADRPGESLAPSATPLLQRLGLYDAFLATAPLPCYGNRSCWGASAPQTYDFIRDPYGHGWHLDRRAFNRMLLESACAQGVALLTGVSLATAQRDRAGWLLGLTTGVRVRARFTIDAGGRAAPVARRLGVHRDRYDQLLAVTVLLSAARACEDSTTLVEAVPNGWWYSATLPSGRLALAFMTDPDLLVANGLCGWNSLRAQLACAPLTRSRVLDSGFEPLAAARVAAAGTSVLQQIAGDGWLACGDAAAAYDPLSSHGIGAGLSAGAHAAATAQAWLDGDRTALDSYAGQVRAAFARYLALWRAYYAEEARWPDAPFWARRRSPLLSASINLRAAGRG